MNVFLGFPDGVTSTLGFPDDSVVKNLPVMQDLQETDLMPGLGRSLGGGNGNPVFLPGKSHGQRRLMGYSPWGHKQLDTTEHTHMHA